MSNADRLLDKKLRQSKWALFLEQLWLRLWLPFTVLGLFLIVSLTGVWPLLGPYGHRIVMGLFVFAGLLSFLPMFKLSWPTREQALARLDKDSTLPHRPASSFDDNLATQFDNPRTRQLWLTYKHYLANKIKKLRVKSPHPRTDAHDPFALRALMILILAVLFFGHGKNSFGEIARAFQFEPFHDRASLRIDAWVTPPDYTGKPPMLIADGSKTKQGTKLNVRRDGTNPDLTPPENISDLPSFNVPQNAELVIRVNGSNASKVELLIEASQNPEDQNNKGDANQTVKNLERILKDPPATNPSRKISETDDKVQPRQKSKNENQIQRHFVSSKDEKSGEFRRKLKHSQKLALMIDGQILKQWQFEITPDHIPVIRLLDLPTQVSSGAMKLDYQVKDDYGVIEAHARFKILQSKASRKKPLPQQIEPRDLRYPLGQKPDFSLNLPSLNAKDGKAETYKDLTGHPWAGIQVTMQLEAKDEGENIGRSPALSFVIPERKFTKPLARRLVRERKRLIATPYKKRLIARSLVEILQTAPEALKDQTLFLGLQVVRYGLQLRKTRAELEELADLMWQLARRIEDGDLSRAEQQLRLAQEELRRALENGASEQEISKLIDKLRQALRDYMQALAKQQQNQQQQQADNPSKRSLNAEQLEQMLKNIEELAKSGSKDLAKQMLAELQNMLENIERGKSAQSRGQDQLSKSLKELGELMRKQQQLLDDTYKQRRRANQQGNRQGKSGQQNQSQNRSSQRPNGQSGQWPNGEMRQGQSPQGQKGQLGQGQLGQRQQSLQQQLDRLIENMQKNMGQVPKGLGAAEQSMGNAGQRLNQGQLSGALREQGNALEQMRRGAKALANQMQQNGNGGGRRMGGNDPLGRPEATRGLDTGDSVKIPDQIDIQRAREILRELRSRSGDPRRPQIELDYIDRLLKRF